jgi:hypothetical protein
MHPDACSMLVVQDPMRRHTAFPTHTILHPYTDIEHGQARLGSQAAGTPFAMAQIG